MNILRLEKTLEVTKSNFPHSLQILPAPPQMIKLSVSILNFHQMMPRTASPTLQLSPLLLGQAVMCPP